MTIEVQSETLYEIKSLLIRLNFLSKCAIDPTVKTEEIEKIFEGLGLEADQLLKQLKE